ncbi:MAG: threonine ammonia-lyase [Roseibium sp.]
MTGPAFDDPAQVTFEKIQEAAKLIKGAVLETPCLPAPRLSQLTGADVYVKYENMQVTGAFKERGALVKLSSLTEAEKARGVIAVSAGNHAQGVAYHAGRLGIPATIVMPVLTPFVKIAATRDYGAEVVLAGNTLAEAKEEADRLAAEKNLVWVHPYDDAHVIHGQGTIAIEMLAQQPDLEILVVPIGGGGLISGIATAAKALKPSIEVIGVETTLYPGMWGAFYGKEVVCEGATIAEGIAVRDIGRLTTAVVKERVDDILLVSETNIERAINAYLTLQRTIAEGAGAAGLAALLSEPERFAGKRVGLVLCGGNIDPRLLSKIVVRELARGGRLVSIRIDTPDRPGVLGEIATVIGDMQGNVVDVEHHRLFLNVPAKGATLDVTFEAFDRPHGERIVSALRERGFVVRYLEIGERMD